MAGCDLTVFIRCAMMNAAAADAQITPNKITAWHFVDR